MVGRWTENTFAWASGRELFDYCRSEEPALWKICGKTLHKICQNIHVFLEKILRDHYHPGYSLFSWRKSGCNKDIETWSYYQAQESTAGYYGHSACPPQLNVKSNWRTGDTMNYPRSDTKAACLSYHSLAWSFNLFNFIVKNWTHPSFFACYFVFVFLV